MVKEREHLVYTASFIMHDMKESEALNVEFSSSPLADGGKGISTKFISPAWLRAHEWLCWGTLTQLPHRSIPGRTLTHLD